MALRWRLVLALAGLVLVLLACAALAYVAWPRARTSEQYRPAPTLFAPPAPGSSMPGGWRAA